MAYYPVDKVDYRTLRSGFWHYAATTPDAPAMVVRGVTRSYGEVQQNALRWAGAIVGLLDRPASRIGVFAYRSEVSYTGVLAALASGATFVPLNPTFPPEKTASMIRQAHLDAIIVDRVCAPQLDQVLSGIDPCPPLLMPDLEAPSPTAYQTRILDRDVLAQAELLKTLPPLTADDIAYLLFTSGSTGAPKGVPVSHGNAVHFMDVNAERYGITSSDRLSQTFDQTFDLSVFDLFLSWHRGACVCSLSTVDLLAPTNIINRLGLTVWFSVPSVPAQMRRRNSLKPGTMPNLRWSLFCGEPLPRASAEAWQAAAPNSIVENLYGPTELTISCLVHRWDPVQSPALCYNEVVPIGRPLPGLGATIVDDELKPVAPGEPGELCVCGPQTTPGYWNDPTRTAERFVTLPVSAFESRRFYRTGDRVQCLPNGEYVYIGRTDHQIKVLGHRVELGEVEAALRVDTHVTQVAALGWPLEQGGAANGIVAFVTGTDIDPENLKAQAAQQLQAYSVPQQIFVIEDMPMNANGKIDRLALRRRLQEKG